MRHSVLRGETGRATLQIIRCSQEPILWAQFLYLPISRKTLKSFMVTLLLVTRKDFTRLIETFWKIRAWLHVLPLHQKSHLYWHPTSLLHPPATTSLEQFFRGIWGSVSQAAILILPEIKFNLLLSHCAIFFFKCKLWTLLWASLVAQMIKPANWEMGVLSLGWEDPLKEEMATLSSILAWEISWKEEPGRIQLSD